MFKVKGNLLNNNVQGIAYQAAAEVYDALFVAFSLHIGCLFRFIYGTLIEN